ncbi:hypothetical protein GobsT_37290 [Gemmata obscuriglobus]|nr:hypothetical protein [Gemmata obscuriglobus]QEG27503.1 hypothetical protein GobsT_22590 [Gemmata obscuriglobus]QEG28940.1 hypothetical protein GobsT_37290 [Gemmata obscuriglobus]VTS04525.1 unnamed protein product [Gemmata obscuriglobus UQM 2246]VTS07455.1 unnamed protein product [Gemmata obscuriglobus UQM 2246]
MPRPLLAFVVFSLSASPGMASDLKAVIYEVQSVTVPSGKHAGADGFLLRAEPQEGEKDGRTVTVPDLKSVRLTINGKAATRAEVIGWVSDQRYPRVEVTTDPQKNDAPVQLRFYGCPPESRGKKSDK